MPVWGQAAWPRDGTSGGDGWGGLGAAVLCSNPRRWDPCLLSIPLVSSGFMKLSRKLICSQLSHTLSSRNKFGNRIGGEEGLVLGEELFWGVVRLFFSLPKG